MAPPKKAAKKVAKKAAKKSAGNPNDKHHQTKDLRRAYEHMGRIAILSHNQQSPAAEDVAELTALAQQALKREESRDAAELLRASEHLSFAALAGKVAGSISVSLDLKQAITEQFEDLLRRAEEHWEQKEAASVVAGIYASSRRRASDAFKAHAYLQALEYARAAEALAHVTQQGAPRLHEGHGTRQLKSVS